MLPLFHVTGKISKPDFTFDSTHISARRPDDAIQKALQFYTRPADPHFTSVCRLAGEVGLNGVINSNVTRKTNVPQRNTVSKELWFVTITIGSSVGPNVMIFQPKLCLKPS